MASRLLPEVLQPLGDVLAMMNETLVTAYKSFEETFDGSRMSLVFEEFKPLLVLLEERAESLVRVEPPIQNLKSNMEVVNWFYVVSPEEKRDLQVVER